MCRLPYRPEIKVQKWVLRTDWSYHHWSSPNVMRLSTSKWSSRGHGLDLQKGSLEDPSHKKQGNRDMTLPYVVMGYMMLQLYHFLIRYYHVNRKQLNIILPHFCALWYPGLILFFPVLSRKACKVLVDRVSELVTTLSTDHYGAVE